MRDAHWTPSFAGQETAQHLAARYGTAAHEVLELAKKTRDLAKPLVGGLAPIRAEIAYSVTEMALTIQDVLARRIGLEFFSWRASIEAAPVVGSILGKELGWSAKQIESATQDYVGKIGRYLKIAGLESVPSRSL